MSTPPDMNAMLEQARRLQSQVGELQRELGTRRYEASSGGGMVTAVVSGHLRVLEIRIEAGLTEGDREMLQDLTAAAVNAALEKAQRGVQEELQRLTGGLPVAGLGGLPGMGG